FLCQRDIVFALDASTYCDDHIGFAQIDSLLYLLERRFRFHPHFTNVDGHFLDRSTTGLHRLIRAKSAGLKSSKQRRLAIGHYICVQLAEKDAARKGELAYLDVHTNAITDQSFAEARGTLGRKIAHQVGMRHNHILWVQSADDLLHR